MADAAPTTHGHSHSHGHGHSHSHGHGHSHGGGGGHGHSHGDGKHKTWDADEYYEFPGVLEMAQSLSKWLQSQPWWKDNTDILDYGCGPGTLLIDLAAKAKSITGIDISKSMIDRFKLDVSKASLTNATAVLATTEDGSELASDSADVAMVNCVLHHAAKPEAIIANLARAVRLGGHVTVSEFAETKHMTKRVDEADETTHAHEVHFCKLEDLQAWFKAAGLEVIGEPTFETIKSDKDAAFSMDIMYIAGCKKKQAKAASTDDTATTAAAASTKK